MEEFLRFLNQLFDYDRKRKILNNLPIYVLKNIPDAQYFIENGEIKDCYIPSVIMDTDRDKESEYKKGDSIKCPSFEEALKLKGVLLDSGVMTKIDGKVLRVTSTYR